MSRRLEGKTAIVTGGSRGIGRAIAERLAEEGAAVIVNYVSNEALATEVVEKIRTNGGKGHAIKADVSQVPEIRQLFAEAEEKLGPVDIVVANAAVFTIKTVIESTEEDYERIFGTNARGVFFILQEAGRRVRDNGRIIVISTGGTQMYMDKIALYLGSKGATEQFVRVLSRELGPRNVTVNAVSPGFTDTDMLPERDRAHAASMSPFNRVGAPREVANAVLFLASEDGAWVTGQNLAAGGGVF